MRKMAFIVYDNALLRATMSNLIVVTHFKFIPSLIEMKRMLLIRTAFTDDVLALK